MTKEQVLALLEKTSKECRKVIYTALSQSRDNNQLENLRNMDLVVESFKANGQANREFQATVLPLIKKIY